MNVLILGYGRAGQRHAASAKVLGLSARTVDPYSRQKPTYLDRSHIAVDPGYFDLAVIATPPAQHFDDLEYLVREIKPRAILLEKPVCDFGQVFDVADSFPNSSPIIVAFNWRYHPILRNLPKLDKGKVELSSMRNRMPPPSWGILLDHLAHSIDIVSQVAGKLVPETFTLAQTVQSVGWTLDGKSESGVDFEISETVWIGGTKHEEETIFRVNNNFFNIAPDPTMFQELWRDFVACARGEIPNPIPLEAGLDAQLIIEDIVRNRIWVHG